MSISVKGTIDLTSAFLRKNRNSWQVSFKIYCRMHPNLRYVKMRRNIGIRIEKMWEHICVFIIYDIPNETLHFAADNFHPE